MSDVMTVENTEMQIREYNGQRVVTLLHLSSQNGNPERFREEIEELVDCDVDVWVAEKGIERELRLEPF